MLVRTLWISASILLSSFALAVPASNPATLAESKACADLPGRVFKNCVDGSFPGLHALEFSKDLTTSFDITDGTAGNLINWSILASHEPGHNKVIDVQFKSNTNFYGLFNVIPAAGTEDLSAYAKGALEFDVRILSRGIYNVPLLVKLECIYPCQSGEYVLDVPQLNQWTSISLPIADMVRDGLDLTKVNIPFQILPAWGVQDGAHFQVDNIRWVKQAPKSSSSSSSKGGALSSKSSSKAASSVTSSVIKSSVKSSPSKSSKASSSVIPASSSKASSVKSSIRSSASSQSSSPPLSCAYQEGGVYFDATCAPWQNISAYEQNADASIHQEVTNGSGYSVNLGEVDSTDSNHNKVLDIRYNSNPEFNGTVRLRSIDAAGVDMSAYATGKLVFDIKVITSSDDNGDIEMALDCGWPCTNTERIIKVPALNQWTTIELSVADLIRDGLDIKHLYGGFQIAAAWGHQANAHFQLDNIRWVKGSTPITTQDCWAQRFNTYDPLTLRIDQLVSTLGEVGVQMPQIVPNTIFNINWLVVSKWGYAAGTDANFANCGTNGTLSASVYLPVTYVNDGHLTLSFYAIDQGGGMTFSQSISVVNLKGGDWNFISTPLWFYNSTSGFNSNGVTFLGVVFDANGKDPSIGGILRVDNILVTQPIQ
jgi:hypothetical protein